jgi:hypothetical protein
MKTLIYLLFWSSLGALTNAETIPAAPPNLPDLLGDALPEDQGWSKRVNGVQARFSIGPGRIEDGTWIPAVYIEFHNSRNSSTPVIFDFSVYNDLRLQLRTKEGLQAPEPRGITASAFSLPNFHVSLPSGGTLKFPINWRGHGHPKDHRMMLDFEKSVWEVPTGDAREYFLSATLTVPPIPIGAKPNAYRYWSGELKIPPSIVAVPSKPK